VQSKEDDSQFSRPQSITVDDSSGRAYVSDTSINIVQIFQKLTSQKFLNAYQLDYQSSAINIDLDYIS
jgi:hypothetical protein